MFESRDRRLSKLSFKACDSVVLGINGVYICSHMGGIGVDKTRLASKCVQYLFHPVFDEVLVRCMSFLFP